MFDLPQLRGEVLGLGHHDDHKVAFGQAPLLAGRCAEHIVTQSSDFAIDG